MKKKIRARTGRRRKKKKQKRIKIKFNEIISSSRLSPHWECSIFWCLFSCSVKFLRFLGLLLSLTETGLRAEDVQKPTHQNNQIQVPFAGLTSVGSLCQSTEHSRLLFPGFVHILLYALGYWFAEKIYLLSKLLPSGGLFLNGDFSLSLQHSSLEKHISTSR